VQRPLYLSTGKRRLALRVARFGVRVDIDETVARALAPSERGSILTRTWRRPTDPARRVDVMPRVTYSQAAVRRFARRVARRVDRPARRARVAVVAAARFLRRVGALVG
jgi:hypothetical protein